MADVPEVCGSVKRDLFIGKRDLLILEEGKSTRGSLAGSLGKVADVPEVAAMRVGVREV